MIQCNPINHALGIQSGSESLYLNNQVVKTIIKQDLRIPHRFQGLRPFHGGR